MKKLIVGLCAAVCAAVTANAGWNVVQESSKWYLAEDGVENGWKFTASVSGQNVSVTGISSTGDSSSTNPKVLDFTTINGGYSLVTFKGLGNSGDSPSANAQKVSKIIFPTTITSLGSQAFRGANCIEFDTAFLKNVTKLDNMVFRGCAKLTGDIELDSVTVLGLGVFQSTKITSLKLPDAITTVPGSLCQSCGSLTQVTLGNAVTAIGENAFYGTKLVEMNFPKTLRTIGSQGFRDVPLAFPATLFPQLTSIGSSGFSACANLTCDVVLTNCTSIGGTAFKTAKFKSVVFGDGLTSLSAYTFQNGALTNVVFGSGDLTVAKDAFQGCSSIRQYYFANYPALADGWITKPKTGTGVRAFVPKTDATWISKMTAATFTKWADCEEADQDAYFKAFGTDAEKPTGYTTDPLAMWLIAYGGSEQKSVRLRIEGDPKDYGTGEDVVVPDYGDYADVSTSLPLTVSASTYYADGLTLRRCTGYTIETYDDDTMEWKNPQSSSALTFTYDPAESVYNRVKWHWTAVGHQIGFGDMPEGTSVIMNPQPDLEGYYTPGTVVTLTAVGDGFVRWYGDGIDEATASNRTQTATIDGEKNMTPYFVRNWTYAGGKVTDGYWTLKASLAGTKVTIGKPSVLSVVSTVDFTKPLNDGYVFAGIDSSAFYDSTLPIVEMRLPKTIETVGGQAFRTAAFKINLDFLEGVRVLDSSVFTDNDTVDGDVRLLNATTLDVYAFNRTSKIRSIVFGEGVTSVPSGFCASCGSITNAVFGASVASIGDSAFMHAYSLREMHFASLPTFGAGWNTGKKGTGVRAFVERESWAPIFASNEVFTAWKDCTPAQTNAYFTAFGVGAKRPRGYTTYPHEMWLLPYSTKRGFGIILR